ncbi:tetratricopeptide repeat protein [Ascoidea rubescens DSM 1968]|uniref:HCP-like protein n=1 Tax=Ascoidea rubescens DSM 1968 TaxID=1344418 RepID=A0A1D2VMB3_9ASCO|nr:HCP-like protein [Ascoidea rubescens DSM 1968]ODV62758.1 HCP-like protein [Ascoidea rubescens DSM 1968]
MYRVAVCYELGVGTRKDDIRAFSWFERASKIGVITAMYKLGMCYLMGELSQQKSAAKAIEYFEKAAKSADFNNPHSLYELGKLYEGVYPISSPVNNLSKSDGNFMRELRKIIVEINEKKAFEYYLRAAKLEHAPSQSKLGWCYEYGKLCCVIDPKRSVGWYSRAAAQGYALAEMALCGWYITGASGVLEKNDKEAYLWARRAAEKGLAKAEYALGHFSENGLGTAKSIEEAKRWYMRAASQRHPKAIQRLQNMRGN